MKTGNDIDKISIQAVVDGIGEAMEESPTKPHSDLREGLRDVGDQFDDVFKTLHKLVAKAWTLRVVPFSGQHNV